jgi:hypothetical protein
MIITQEMSQAMLMDSKLTDIFWTHAVHKTIHIQNRVMLKNNNDKIVYELWKGSANNNLYIKKFAKDMQNEFEISLHGELSFFFGLQICQSNQGIFISQTKYIREMLKRLGMEYCKLVTTPMQTSCELSKDDDSDYTDRREYGSMIDSLLYVTTSRPDVMQEVGQVARFREAPKESHVLAVKRILRCYRTNR